MKKTVCQFDMCNGCNACVSICPQNCISIQDDIRCINAVIDCTRCIDCKLCIQVCPNINKPILLHPIDSNQGWAVDEIRKNASSGGAASAIMKAFIEEGGYVASCCLRNGKFVFEVTNNMEQAKRMAGSKYVKSNPQSIYRDIKNLLMHHKVLFIGLPCQVSALKNYVKNSNNLYTIDLICHGTPSPKLLEKFLQEKHISLDECSDIAFRRKSEFGIRIDGKRVEMTGMDDYMISFLNAICYTNNCYECQFATIDRVGDLSLGDAWGSEYKEEERMGISLILTQTSKGRELLQISGLKMVEFELDRARSYNRQLNSPSQRDELCNQFFDYILNGKTYQYTMFSLYKKRITLRYLKSIQIWLRSVLHIGGE